MKNLEVKAEIIIEQNLAFNSFFISTKSLVFVLNDNQYSELESPSSYKLTSVSYNLPLSGHVWHVLRASSPLIGQQPQY